MDTDLRRSCALITGGASGIGFGIAQVLADEGVDLAVASRNPDPAALEELRARGVKCVRIVADVSKEEDSCRMVAEAIAGLGRIDLFVNNAGAAWHQPITKVDASAWQRTLDTNLNACVWACREIARHMIARRSGSIVMIGSVARVNPAFREAAYRASKAALRSYMESVAIELAPYAIRVNMVSPGHYLTQLTADVPPEVESHMRELIPLHRFGDPREIGYAVAMLASERLSGYTTGVDLVVDGGLILRPLPVLTLDESRQLNT